MTPGLHKDYRSRLEISKSVLQTLGEVRGTALNSNMVYRKANLAPARFTEIIQPMMDNGLILQENNGRIKGMIISDKGVLALRTLTAFEETLGKACLRL